MSDKQPQQLLYVKPFDASSYSNWEFRIKLLLEQQGVLNVLTEEVPSQASEEYAKFMKNDVKARTIIVQCVSDNILEMLKTKRTAKEIMESLNSTYSKKGISTQVTLQRKLRSLKFGEGQNLSAFFTEFDQTISKLKSAGGNIDESELILQVLSSMPESYQAVTVAIDIMFCQNQTKVSLVFVKNKLLMEETRQHKNQTESDNVAFAGYKNRRGNLNRRPFANANTRGGTSGGNYYQGNPGGNFRFRCHQCNEIGHKRYDCPRNSNRHGNFNRNNRGSGRGGAQLVQPENQGNEEHNISFLTSLEEYVSDVSDACMSCDSSFIHFIVDSGATNHLVKLSLNTFLLEGKDVSQRINVAKQGESIVAKKQGNICVKSETGRSITIKNVLVCDNLFYNLLSVRKLEESGLEVVFKEKKVIITKNKDIILEGKLKGSLYTVSFWISGGENFMANTVFEDQWLLYRKMGHASQYPSPGLCEVCIKGKQTRLPFLEVSDDRKAKRILEIVSSDVCGPIQPMTHDGKNYFVSFIDHYSHFSVCYLLSKKSEVLEKFQLYVSMVETKFNTKIEKIRCDNGGEYSSIYFRNFCNQKGIKIQYTVAYNPEQNGVAERFNRTIMEKARCLIFDSELNKEFLGEAVRSSVYLTNRLETRALNENKTPAEIWYGHKINIDKIKLFGCAAYNFVPKEIRKSKLDPHCQTLIMIGYTDNGYRLWDENKIKVIHGRNIIFEEKDVKKLPNIVIEKDQIESDSEIEKITNTNEKKSPENHMEENLVPESVEEILDTIKSSRRSLRKKQVPQYLKDYKLDTDFEEFNLVAALSASNFLFELPKTYSEAQDSRGKDTVHEELKSMQENKTWDLVLPPDKAEIKDSKWLFRKKRSKRIDVKHYFIRNCVHGGKILLNYIPTEKQQADIFTKALPRSKSKYFRSCMNVIDTT